MVMTPGLHIFNVSMDLISTGLHGDGSSEDLL